MRNKKDAIGLALQIVYEYDNWGSEHISDMMATYEDTKPPCNGNELYDLCNIADTHKKAGLSFKDAEKQMIGKK